MKRGILGFFLLSFFTFCSCRSDRFALERAYTIHSAQFRQLGFDKPLWGGRLIPDRWVEKLYLLDGDIYAITSNHEIHSIGPKGFHKWIFTQHRAELDAAPCVNDRSFCFVCKGDLYVLDKETGETLVKKRLSVTPCSDPVATSSTLFYGGWVGESLYSIDLKTGRPGWHFRTGDNVSAPLILSGSPPVPLIHFASEESSVYAIPAVSALENPPSRITWKDAQAGLCEQGMASDANALYVATRSNGLIAYQRATGIKMWVFYPEGILVSKPVVFRDLVFVKAASLFDEHKRTLYAIETANGKARWELERGDRVIGRMGHLIFVLEEPFQIHIIDGRDGNCLKRVSLDQFNLFVTARQEGMLYVGNSAGFIYALKGL